jgi:hypothetical protein
MYGSGNGPKGLELVLIECEDDLSHLAEFQTPTIFDHDGEFNHSIFYWAPKIIKIIICIL